MDIEWGVSKRSKASKRGKRIDRIVSSKLALLDGVARRNFRNFSKIFGHEFATEIKSRRTGVEGERERELLSPLLRRILLQTRAKTFR